MPALTATHQNFDKIFIWGPTTVAREGVLTVGVNRQSIGQNFGVQPAQGKSALIIAQVSKKGACWDHSNYQSNYKKNSSATSPSSM